MGDLNDLQTLGLLTCIKQEREEFAEIEWERFKRSIIAAHPDQAETLLKALETEPEAHARPLSDEEMEDYVPLTGSEIEHALRDLRELGLYAE